MSHLEQSNLHHVRCFGCGTQISNIGEQYDSLISKGVAPNEAFRQLGVTRPCCMELIQNPPMITLNAEPDWDLVRGFKLLDIDMKLEQESKAPTTVTARTGPTSRARVPTTPSARPSPVSTPRASVATPRVAVTPRVSTTPMTTSISTDVKMIVPMPLPELPYEPVTTNASGVSYEAVGDGYTIPVLGVARDTTNPFVATGRIYRTGVPGSKVSTDTAALFQRQREEQARDPVAYKAKIIAAQKQIGERNRQRMETLNARAALMQQNAQNRYS